MFGLFMAAEAKVSCLLCSKGSPDRQVGKCVSEALDVVREARLYRPDLVLLYGAAVRKTFGVRSVEYWDLTEQIAVAAADRGLWQLFDRLFRELRERFPESWRVQLVEGVGAEMRNHLKVAMSLYMQILAKDPMKSSAYKRQVAVLKAQRKIPEAISVLNYYVSLFRGDMEAWAELCALCMSNGRYEHALFCANEIVLHDRDNYAAHIVVADVHMTIGGSQHMLSARRHYAASVARKRRGNVRALFGLWLAANRLHAEDRWKESSYDEGSVRILTEDGETEPRPEPTEAEKRRENAKIIAWARDALLATYRSPTGSGDSRKSDAKAKGREMLEVVSAATQ